MPPTAPRPSTELTPALRAALITHLLVLWDAKNSYAATVMFGCMADDWGVEEAQRIWSEAGRHRLAFSRAPASPRARH